MSPLPFATRGPGPRSCPSASRSTSTVLLPASESAGSASAMTASAAIRGQSLVSQHSLPPPISFRWHRSGQRRAGRPQDRADAGTRSRISTPSARSSGSSAGIRDADQRARARRRGRRRLRRGRLGRRRRRSAAGRSVPSTSLCLRMPERDVGDSSSDLGLELAEALGARTEEEPITDALEALGCYRRRDEAIRQVFDDYEPSWRHKVVRSAPTGGMTFFSLVVERPDGTTERRRMPPGPVPRPDRGDEHEAAHPQAARVHLGRPARICGDRDAEPARVRPGVLRQGRRRARRREAGGRALQGPDVRARPRARPAGGDRRRGRRPPRPSASRRPRRSSTSAIRTSRWTCSSGAARATSTRPSWRRWSGSSRPRSRSPTRRSTGAASRPRTCTRRRSSSTPTPSMCGIAGIVHPEPGPAGRRGRPAADGARDPPPRPRRLRLRARSRRRAGLRAAGDLRPARAAGSRSRPSAGERCWSTTARSTTTPSCAPSSRRRGERFETTCDTEVVLRLLERDGLAALDRLNGQFAFAWWQPGPSAG